MGLVTFKGNETKSKMKHPSDIFEKLHAPIMLGCFTTGENGPVWLYAFEIVCIPQVARDQYLFEICDSNST